MTEKICETCGGEGEYWLMNDDTGDRLMLCSPCGGTGLVSATALQRIAPDPRSMDKAVAAAKGLPGRKI